MQRATSHVAQGCNEHQVDKMVESNDRCISLHGVSHVYCISQASQLGFSGIEADECVFEALRLGVRVINWVVASSHLSAVFAQLNEPTFETIQLTRTQSGYLHLPNKSNNTRHSGVRFELWEISNS